MADVKDYKILVVDDMQSLRESMRNCLTAIGFKNIKTAVNGLDGVSKLQEEAGNGNPYDMVFCDINMPEMSGIEFLKAARDIPQYASIPIFMVSTVNETDTILDTVVFGADNYILKPFTTNTVKDKIHETLKKKKIIK